MTYIGTNLIAIFSAALISLGISALYHVVFGAEQSNAGLGHNMGLALITLIAEFWLAVILAGALILVPVDADAWTIAIVTPIVIWIGFVLPAPVVSFSARRLRPSVIALDCVRWLVVMVARQACFTPLVLFTREARRIGRWQVVHLGLTKLGDAKERPIA